MSDKQKLDFYEKLLEFSFAMNIAHEKGDWDSLEHLVVERTSYIQQHEEKLVFAPSKNTAQKIRIICEEIQKIDKVIMEDATQWREQIQKFILK